MKKMAQSTLEANPTDPGQPTHPLTGFNMSASLRETNGFHKPLKAGYFWGKTGTFGVGGRLTLAIRSESTLVKGMLPLQAK